MEDLYGIFSSRDSFIFFTLFHKFTGLGLDDPKFADFLSYFKDLTAGQDMNDFYGIDRNSSTKDKTVIVRKLDRQETLMCEYLNVNREDLKETDAALAFVRENVSSDMTAEDVGLYEDMLEDFSSKVDSGSKLLERHNHVPLIAVIAYACNNDIQVDGWIVDYCRRNNDYISGQKENYSHMADDLKEFVKLADAA